MDNNSRGDVEESRLPSAAIAGQATFTGCLAVVNVARQELRSVLPSSITLPPTESDDFRCLLAFGQQREGTTFFGGLSVPWGISYHELMVSIPFVRWHDEGNYLFVSGMMCDFLPAVWNGNAYYGFRKRFAEMTCDGARFAAAGEDGAPCFHASARGRGVPPDLHWISTAVTLPVLGQREDGDVVQSRFDWGFRDATVEAVDLHMKVRQPFPTLPAGEHLAELACRVHGMRWRLSWPAPAITEGRGARR
jgi:hypothetical protein